MLKETRWMQFGEKGLEPNCITIHNTKNYSMSAKDLFNYMNDECLTSQGCHYLVDNEGVIEVMPLDWKVYHTGKGKDYAFNHSIAIEICNHISNDLYLKGQDNAIKLIKQLMKKYNIKKEDIYFHNDFNSRTYCPNKILDLYKNKKNFIEKFF